MFLEKRADSPHTAPIPTYSITTWQATLGTNVEATQGRASILHKPDFSKAVLTVPNVLMGLEFMIDRATHSARNFDTHSVFPATIWKRFTLTKSWRKVEIVWLLAPISTKCTMGLARRLKQVADTHSAQRTIYSPYTLTSKRNFPAPATTSAQLTSPAKHSLTLAYKISLRTLSRSQTTVSEWQALLDQPQQNINPRTTSTRITNRNTDSWAQPNLPRALSPLWTWIGNLRRRHRFPVQVSTSVSATSRASNSERHRIFM